MLPISEKRVFPRQRRAAVWFALFGVFLLQLSSAAHHFEHVDGYVEAACKTCVQLDRVDDFVAGHATTADQVPFADRPELQSVSASTTETSARDFDARAPPYL